MPSPLNSFSSDLVMVLDPNDSSAIARAMRAGGATAAGGGWRSRASVVWREMANSPAEVPSWLARRAWRCLYATADGRFQRPLFAVQIALLAPALWGTVVCLRQRTWRWPATASLLLVAAFWVTAAVAEPLARSLAPVGAMLVIFAIVGAADFYERAFGRQLSA
ncbi:MAG: hypothetical protein HY718_08185 [Planctomycetes bacterium]|nr:hypothetical protein [Planctomycetota bacterium]